MIAALPALGARIAEKRVTQMEDVTAALVTRIDDPSAARVLTAAAYSVVDVAWQRWARDETAVLRDVLDDVFDVLADAGGTPHA